MSALVNNTLQRLATEHHWLGKDIHRTARLGELLREVLTHSGKDAVQLISRLINRFIYVSNDEFDEYMLLIAEFLTETFDLSESLICATTADREKDSAQVILYSIITSLATLGEYKSHGINRYTQAVGTFKKNLSLKQIILVDEFLGTGQSVLGRVKWLEQSFSSAGMSVPPIHFVGLAGMEFGLRCAAPHLNSINVCISLRKGIQDLSLKHDRAMEYALMDLIESSLAPSFEGIELPVYGYGNSEALYSRKSGNCPNNVFPIFWWPLLKNAISRRPLFPRAL